MTSYYVLNSHYTVRLCLGKSEGNAPQSDTHRACQKMWKKLGQTWFTSRITYANKRDWTAPHAPKDSEQCTYLFDFFFWTHIPIWFVRTYVRPVHSGVISVTSGTNSQTWTARPLPYSVKDAHPSLHQASGKPILTNLQILITRAWTGTSPPRCQFYRASSQRYAKAHDAQGVIIAWSWSLQRRASGS